ncbi:oxidoreductase [Agarilytica rhodophyticola]|uniref:oxidoreductase n=1 Tax=Agarilytica rhodophyticola TaxID=1737490 RepID=UPI000B348C0A|nr:oxidoreductase [Agarilytica rhodophyticola]
MIKVGVVGYGYSARTFHVPIIKSMAMFELTAISSSNPRMVQEKLPDIKVFDTATELIVNANVDLIVITAPNSVHYPLAMECLENGIHVIVEKPMVTTSKEAKTLTEFAEKKKLTVSAFQNRRWDGDFLTVKRLISTKAIGDIRFFESHFDRFRPLVRKRWKEEPVPGAGIWFDLGSHLVDQTLCLFGLPEKITARCLKTRDNSKTVDYFHVQLHYPHHLEVVLHASSFSAGPNKRFHLEGTQGSFTKYGLDPQEQQLNEGLTPEDKNFGIEDRENFGTLFKEDGANLVETEVGCYQHYYSAIANAINNNTASPISGAQAINVIQILELAELSSRKGITVLFDSNYFPE